MKRTLLIITAIALLVTVGLILQKIFSGSETPITVEPRSDNPILKDQRSKSDYRMDPAMDYVLDAHKEVAYNKAKAFVLLGRGANGRVANLNGNIIFKPESGDGVYAAEPNPKGDLVCIYLGKKSFVLNPWNHEIVNIPTKPADPGMLSFGSWAWIDDDNLIATSGLQELDATGKPSTCCGGHNVKATKLYTFRVSSRKLSKIDLPESIKAQTFTLNQVSSDRYFELATDENELVQGHKTGWFRIVVP